jgi:hypothetical protein
MFYFLTTIHTLHFNPGLSFDETHTTPTSHPHHAGYAQANS